MVRKIPSHIQTTPHPDGPQRFTELYDVDVSSVDWSSTLKKYALQYNNNPDIA
jgi:hypothetical protein